MGFWNDGIQQPSSSSYNTYPSSHQHTHHKPRSRSRSRSSSPTRRRPATRTRDRSTSFFSLPNTSFFSTTSSRGPSYSRSSRARTRAGPRDGFIHKLRRFLRELYTYMRRHPIKVFLLVIMPLVTGGALTRILAQFGVRLPVGLQPFVGGGGGGFGGRGGVREEERFYARGGARDFDGGSVLPGMGGGVGDAIQGALGIAKMFL